MRHRRDRLVGVHRDHCRHDDLLLVSANWPSPTRRAHARGVPHRIAEMLIPRRDWFRMQPPSDLHGLGHTARVMVWAGVLACETPWFDEVMWAAACHDMRRRDDGDDPDHGFRAGRWVRRF